MVRGLDIFKKYFEQYPGNYVIIGGTACDIIIDEAGFYHQNDINVLGSSGNKARFINNNITSSTPNNNIITRIL